MGKRKGFTFIEIALFLAVTAALFLGVALGVSNSIFQQQYNDATQNFYEFMRSVYSQVSNPQGTGQGNSDTAIYGKLVVFGQGMDYQGHLIADGQQIYVYDVIGDATGAGTGDVKVLLNNLKITVFRIQKNVGTGDITSVNYAGVEKYDPRWGSAIQVKIDGSWLNPSSPSRPNLSILVVRHPRSGTINTLVYKDAVPVNERYWGVGAPGIGISCVGAITCSGAYMLTDDNYAASPLKNYFDMREVDFCINPYGTGTGALPLQDVRLQKNARNASGVQMIDLDGDDNVCN